MRWTNYVIIGLLVLSGGWMAYDGSKALVTGDYTTPQTGEYAGQLGPWSNLVSAVGIEPRSTVMKLIFVGIGVLAMGTAVAFTLQLPWARTAVGVTAVLGLWYLPIGTTANLIILLLLFLGK